MHRYAKIAEKELHRVAEAKSHNREFIDMVERSKNLLLAVTPDREVQSIDGIIPFEMITDVNLSKRSPQKWFFKKPEINHAFKGEYEKIQGSPEFFSKINQDEVT